MPRASFGSADWGHRSDAVSNISGAQSFTLALVVGSLLSGLEAFTNGKTLLLEGDVADFDKLILPYLWAILGDTASGRKTCADNAVTSQAPANARL